jgi:putative sigma-54 modulation protein
MQIEVKGRNVRVSDELRSRVVRRFAKVDRQVSELARLEVTLCEEPTRSARSASVAEGTLFLKGVTLHGEARSDSLINSINLVANELARQVERHRDKRRNRRSAPAIPEAPPTP